MLWAAPAAAQERRENQAAIEIVPRIGAHFVDKLTTFRSLQAQRASSGLDESAILGLAIDFDLPVSGLFFRLAIDRTLGARLITKEHVGFESCGQDCQQSVDREVPLGVSGALWVLGLDLRYRPFSSTWPIRPYLVGGTGLKHFAVDESGLREAGYAPNGRRNSGSLQIGAGADFELWGRPLRIEMIDAIGPLESPVVHDLLITLGARFPLD